MCKKRYCNILRFQFSKHYTQNCSTLVGSMHTLQTLTSPADHMFGKHLKPETLLY